jgi:hypothetical protein
MGANLRLTPIISRQGAPEDLTPFTHTSILSTNFNVPKVGLAHGE